MEVQLALGFKGWTYKGAIGAKLLPGGVVAAEAEQHVTSIHLRGGP